MPKMTSVMPIYWEFLVQYNSFINNKTNLNVEERKKSIRVLYRDIRDIEEILQTFKNRNGKIENKVRNALVPIKRELKKLLEEEEDEEDEEEEEEEDEFILEISNHKIFVDVSFNIFFGIIIYINN